MCAPSVVTAEVDVVELECCVPALLAEFEALYDVFLDTTGPARIEQDISPPLIEQQSVQGLRTSLAFKQSVYSIAQL
jgi:hypothetical protein